MGRRCVGSGGVFSPGRSIGHGERRFDGPNYGTWIGEPPVHRFPVNFHSVENGDLPEGRKMEQFYDFI